MKTTPEVEDWLNKLKPHEHSIVEELQILIRQIMPDTIEFIYHNTLVSALTKSNSDWVTYISVFTNHINLSFWFGASINDPEKLLIGTGKRIRHIKIKLLNDAKVPSVRVLLEGAYKNRKENWNKQRAMKP